MLESNKSAVEASKQRPLSFLLHMLYCELSFCKAAVSQACLVKGASAE
jgi:hypothetical protein